MENLEGMIDNLAALRFNMAVALQQEDDSLLMELGKAEKKQTKIINKLITTRWCHQMALMCYPISLN